MRISSETIRHFADKGIVVKNHPLSEDEWSKKVWQDEYKSSYDYHKDGFLGWDENRNEIHYTHEQLHAKATEWADRYTPRRLKDWYNAPNLYIEYNEGGNNRVICQKVNVKSKEITIEYIDKLIAKDRKAYNGTFGKFADAMNKLLQAAGYNGGFWVYPTTYGIGVWVFYNWSADKNIADIERILKANNVEYYNEYSDKMYVYRFKISKRQANIKLALSA